MRSAASAAVALVALPGRRVARLARCVLDLAEGGQHRVAIAGGKLRHIRRAAIFTWRGGARRRRSTARRTAGQGPRSCWASEQLAMGGFEPAAPPSVSVGKKAARATPIRALAAAMRRSAAAMSGRRWSSSRGHARGHRGRRSGWPAAGDREVRGELADQRRDRVLVARAFGGDGGDSARAHCRARFWRG